MVHDEDAGMSVQVCTKIGLLCADVPQNIGRGNAW